MTQTAKYTFNASDMYDEFTDSYLEHLMVIENDFIKLEADSLESINDIYRKIHSLKGVAGILRLNRIMDLAHAMESIINLIRDRVIPANSTNIDSMLTGVDKLREMVSNPAESDQVEIGEELKLYRELMKSQSQDDYNEQQVKIRGVEEFFHLRNRTIDELRRQKQHLYGIRYNLNEVAEKRDISPLKLIFLYVKKGTVLDGKLVSSVNSFEEDFKQVPFYYEFIFAGDIEAAEIAEMIGGVEVAFTEINYRLLLPPSE